MTIPTSNVKVADVNRTTGAATNAIQLENNTGAGSIDIGTVTDTAGQAGTTAAGRRRILPQVQKYRVSYQQVRKPIAIHIRSGRRAVHQQ